MSVTQQSPIASSVANGVTTSFPHAFTVLDAADLVVEGTAADGTTITYTFGVHYTVAGLGTGAGSVDFTAPPAAGMVITRYRVSQLVRSIDYQNNGDLRAQTVNLDFDRIWLALQEMISGAKQVPTAIRVPVGEIVAPLPPAANRLDRLLSFNPGTGAPEISSFTLTQLASVIAAGYAGTAGPLDALTFLQAGAGAVGRTAQDKAREIVSVKDFGAVGDGVTDDTAAIARAVAFVKLLGGGAIFFPRGIYAGSVTLQDMSNVVLFGEGAASQIYRPLQSADGQPVIAIKAVSHAVENITIRDIWARSSAQDNANDSMGIECNRSAVECPYAATNVTVERCIVSMVQRAGILLRQVAGAKVRHNRVFNTGRDGIQVLGSALIEGNDTENTGDDGIGAHGPLIDVGITPSYRIIGNRIGSVRGARGIAVTGCRDTVVVGNTLRGYGIFGIYVVRATSFNEEMYPATRIVIADNIVLDSSSAVCQGGIGVTCSTDQSTFPAQNFTDYPLRPLLATNGNQPGSHLKISGNYVGPSEWQGKTDAAGVTYYNPVRGVRFTANGSYQKVSIQGNDFYGLSVAGVAVELASSSHYGVSKMRILGNDFTACQVAMQLVGGAPGGATWVNDYFVANNTIDGANALGYAAPEGIHATGVRKLFITGNSFANLTTSYFDSNTSESAYNNSFENAPTFGTVKHAYDSGANAWTET